LKRAKSESPRMPQVCKWEIDLEQKVSLQNVKVWPLRIWISSKKVSKMSPKCLQNVSSVDSGTRTRTRTYEHYHSPAWGSISIITNPYGALSQPSLRLHTDHHKPPVRSTIIVQLHIDHHNPVRISIITNPYERETWDFGAEINMVVGPEIKITKKDLKMYKRAGSTRNFFLWAEYSPWKGLRPLSGERPSRLKGVKLPRKLGRSHHLRDLDGKSLRHQPEVRQVFGRPRSFSGQLVTKPSSSSSETSSVPMSV